jgi:transcriptional regulator with XRE-family HTH domain
MVYACGGGDDMPEPIDVERFGQRLRRVREERGFTLERVFKATGVSVATLSRIERGGSKDIDAGTLIGLCNWLGARPEEFTLDAEPPRVPGKRTPSNTPEAVELYLRADKNLDHQTAALLSEMFKAAYRKLAKGGRQGK